MSLTNANTQQQQQQQQQLLSSSINTTTTTTTTLDLNDLPPECEQGNVEYKVKLISPSPDRLQQLITQLKWRLSEGHGEALYQLGVSDNGVLVGLAPDELRQSLETLRSMASELGAELSAVRERSVGSGARLRSRRSRIQREARKLAFCELTRELQMKNNASHGKTLKLTSKDSQEGILVDGLFSSDDSDSDTLDGPSQTDDHKDTLSPAHLKKIEEATDKQMAVELLLNSESEDLSTIDFKVAEVLIRKLVVTPTQHFLEVRLAFLGGTNAGKSTLLGYLSHGELDNGRGKARLNLLRHRHEIESGRTSSISYSVIGFDDHGHLVNYASMQSHIGSPAPDPQNEESNDNNRCSTTTTTTTTTGPQAGSWSEAQVVENASKIMLLIDTCGHPKYFKTTIHGLISYRPDYSCLVVNAQAGELDTSTRQVLGCAMVLEIPVFVVLTKVDLADNEALEATLKCLLQVLMLPGSSCVPTVVDVDQDIDLMVENFLASKATPIFLVSCVTGENVDLLTLFLSILPARPPSPSTLEDTISEPQIEFHIEEVFDVPDVGPVVGGRMISGSISANLHLHDGTVGESNLQPLTIGPVDELHGEFVPCQIVSMHRQRRPAKTIDVGQSGTLAIKIDRSMIRKGMVILSNPTPQSHQHFKARVMILYAPNESVLPSGFTIEDAEAAWREKTCRKRKISSAHYDASRATPSPPISTVSSLLMPHFGTVHIGSIRQTVDILSIVPASLDTVDSTKLHNQSVKTGSHFVIHFRFVKVREHLHVGDKLIFIQDKASQNNSEHAVKMVGQVTKFE